MSSPWLIIDVPNVAFRGFAAAGGLRANAGDRGPLSAAYLFLRQLRHLRARFHSERFVFCFDSRVSRRAASCPTYKANRRERSPAAITLLEPYYTDLHQLRRDILPGLGYRNVLRCSGYEADDLVAAAVAAVPRGEVAVLVSSDHDLFQLLRRERVTQYLLHKKAAYTAADLFRDYGVWPDRWPEVLALAGCPGDGVVGIPGVGLKTAGKFLAGGYKPGGLTWQKLVTEQQVKRTENLPLVKLPYEGTPAVTLRPDVCSAKNRRAVLKRLGFDSLLEDW